jgi:hypothetical protein
VPNAFSSLIRLEPPEFDYLLIQLTLIWINPANSVILTLFLCYYYLHHLQVPASLKNTPDALALPPLALYPSREALLEAIQSWAKPRGYAFTVGKIKKVPNGFQNVYYACDRCPPIRPAQMDRLYNTQTRGTGCLFSILAVEGSIGWEVKYRLEPKFNTHNHTPSQSPAAHHPHRRLPIEPQNTAQQLYSAGVQPRNTLTIMRQIASETPLTLEIYITITLLFTGTYAKANQQLQPYFSTLLQLWRDCNHVARE